jgi:predicted ATPase
VYAVRGYAVYQTMTGDFSSAFATLRELDPLADRIGPPERATIANLRGLASWQVGNLEEALRIVEDSVAVYDPQYSRELIVRSGIEVAVTTIGWAAQLQWVAGRPDLATARARQAVDRARDVDHPLTLSFMLVFAALVESLCGRLDSARTFTDEGLALSERHDIPYFGAYHTLTLSALEPASADSVQRAQQALAEASRDGAVVNAPVVLSMLADMMQRAGAFAESLGVVQMAQGAAQQYGMHMWDAELFRQEADARLALDPSADVEPLYRAAIDFARKQGARSLELRSSLALARLWHGQGRARDAYELLAPVHDAFTEGLDTLDVMTATALLEQLTDEFAAASAR